MADSTDRPSRTPGKSLSELADDFRRAWQQTRNLAEAPDLTRFLPASVDPQRLATLHLLIQIDLEARWQRKQPIALEHYLQSYADLGTSRNLPVRLIYEEYRIRHLFGDRPDVGTYKMR